MGRWQALVDPLLEYLEADRADERGIRERIDDKIWETEKQAENAEMRQPDEKPEARSREFRAELRTALKERLQRDPDNKLLQEAARLLDEPRLRHPDHRR